MTDKISIVLADDHPVFRDGVRRLLEGEADFQVVGMAGDGDEALAQARRLMPNVLLLDVAMPGLAWLDVLRELSVAQAPIRVIVLTAAIADDQMIDALELGARGIVLKEVATDLLFKCIRTVMEGQLWIGRKGVSGLVEGLRSARARRHKSADNRFALTPRQLDIVKAIVTSKTNREIAETLRISEDTVKQHLTTIFDKCGVSNRVELALFAVRNRLVE